jgi:peroxisomal 3,2-trans-enoyl-CoA isomerase
MGHQKASSLILAGDRLTAQELERAGLVTKILHSESFMEDVLTIARRIASFPPEALKFNKNLMMRPVRSSLLEANNLECEGLRVRSASQEPREAIKAFVREKERKRKEQTLINKL